MPVSYVRTNLVLNLLRSLVFCFIQTPASGLCAGEGENRFPGALEEQKVETKPSMLEENVSSFIKQCL